MDRIFHLERQAQENNFPTPRAVLAGEMAWAEAGALWTHLSSLWFLKSHSLLLQCGCRELRTKLLKTLMCRWPPRRDIRIVWADSPSAPSNIWSYCLGKLLSFPLLPVDRESWATGGKSLGSLKLVAPNISAYGIFQELIFSILKSSVSFWLTKILLRYFQIYFGLEISRCTPSRINLVSIQACL